MTQWEHWMIRKLVCWTWTHYGTLKDVKSYRMMEMPGIWIEHIHCWSTLIIWNYDEEGQKVMHVVRNVLILKIWSNSNVYLDKVKALKRIYAIYNKVFVYWVLCSTPIFGLFQGILLLQMSIQLCSLV